MALGLTNQQYQNSTSMFANLAVYAHQRALAPAALSRAACAPYQKTDMMKSYTEGTTLDSNNPAVVRRNARERNRVKQVNNGFTNLRKHLPTAIVADLSNGRRGIGPGANKKLSKVDTLRMAVEYIRRLKRVINDVDSASETSSLSSYSCESSTSYSPPPSMSNQNNYFDTQSYFPITYSAKFQTKESMLISPVGSTGSSTCSTNFYLKSSTDFTTPTMHSTPLKQENSYEEYSNASAEDEDILDYISQWQADM